MTRSNKPNVVFIMADQLKWSALKMYSDIGIETPSLERLASEGVRFSHAITPHPLCVPARTSIMTSRYPHATGCRRNETLMPPNEPHAFRIWKKAGFTTGLIGKNHCFVDQSDLDFLDIVCEISHQGLATINEPGETTDNKGMAWVTPKELIAQSHSTRQNMPRQSPTISYAITDHPIGGYGTSVITDQTLAFLEQMAKGHNLGPGMGDPFALWVSYPDPHEPYEVPRYYGDMFPANKVILPPSRSDEFSDGSAPDRNRVLYEILNQESDSEEDRRSIVATYHAMVRFIDDGVGRILDKLEALGLRENTIVVFTSDHGDFMGEHGMAVKGGVFYDSLVRVPLIVSWPGGNIPPNITDESMVNTVDILPTLLQMQGIANFLNPRQGKRKHSLPYSAPVFLLELQGDDVTDEDLRGFHGQPLPTVTDAFPRRASYSEYGAGGPAFTPDMLAKFPRPLGYPALIDTLWARESEGRRKMVRTEHWKYVTDPMSEPIGSILPSGAHPEDELYDLNSDPWELNNRAADPGNVKVVSEMRSLLAEWMIRTEDFRPVPLPRTIGRE